MKKLFYETEEFLKEKVEKIEREILALTDDGAACCGVSSADVCQCGRYCAYHRGFCGKGYSAWYCDCLF